MTARERGNTLLQAGKLFEAERMYTKGLESVVGGDDEEWKLLMSNRSYARLQIGDLEGSEADARLLTRRCPDYAKGWFRLASVLQALHNKTGAMAAATRCISLDPCFAMTLRDIVGSPTKKKDGPITSTSPAKSSISKPDTTTTPPNAIHLQPGPFSSIDDLVDLMSNLHLHHLGQEALEKLEIDRALGWDNAAQCDEFYDDEDSDSWYYFAYGQLPAGRNAVAGTLVTQGMKSVPFEVVVVKRSVEEGEEGFSPYIDRWELARAIYQYRIRDPRLVYDERVKARQVKELTAVPGHHHVNSEGAATNASFLSRHMGSH